MQLSYGTIIPAMITFHQGWLLCKCCLLYCHGGTQLGSHPVAWRNFLQVGQLGVAVHCHPFVGKCVLWQSEMAGFHSRRILDEKEKCHCSVWLNLCSSVVAWVVCILHNFASFINKINKYLEEVNAESDKKSIKLFTF